ncbi:MAG: hypothetical protein HVN34_12835 [Methanobacteriaceae archaeon]|nr:hypothetical protein [Methanobacteriaceae archaeon]
MTLEIKSTSIPEDQVKDAVVGALKNRINEIDLKLDDLNQNLEYFQRKYHLKSEDFYRQFTEGKHDDEMDFFEWKASWEIQQELKKEKLALLEALR